MSGTYRCDHSVTSHEPCEADRLLTCLKLQKAETADLSEQLHTVMKACQDAIDVGVKLRDQRDALIDAARIAIDEMEFAGVLLSNPDEGHRDSTCANGLEALRAALAKAGAP